MLTRISPAILAISLIRFALVAPGAAAEANCGPRDKVVTGLAEKYQENRRSMGLAGQSAVIELFVSTTGSWTLMATDTKGVACLLPRAKPGRTAAGFHPGRGS